jgi:hypothetical protein
MKRAYPRLSVEDFGRHLLTTGDLDPVYVALNKLNLPRPKLARWLTAYWSFYHCGFASYAADHENFWGVMLQAAVNEVPAPDGNRWPRSAERRHARGEAGIRMVTSLQVQFHNPEVFLDYLTMYPEKLNVATVMQRASEQYLFGRWIAFKIADMIDGVLRIPVAQDDINLLMYETPRKSILHNWRRTFNFPDEAQPRDMDALVAEANAWLADKLSDCTIPHKPGEKPDLFALETVWCKHESHMNGHYPKYKDIVEIAAGVPGWGDLAQEFARHLPHAP